MNETPEDDMAPEAHQNDHSYVDLLSILYARILHGGQLHRGPHKKTVKIGGWALAQGWVLVQDNTVLICGQPLRYLML